MKTDAQLKIDVTDELDWDPAIDAAHVGVAVEHGVVTVAGHVQTLAEKLAIERAVQRVKGVRVIALEVDVKIAPGHRRSDTEIGLAIEAVLKWHAVTGGLALQAKVENGWVTLGGQADWNFQREIAANLVRGLHGVIGLTNLISLKATTLPSPTASQVETQIGRALARQAEREARHMKVSVQGGVVTLQGEVHSWAEAAAAAGAAWSAHGVTQVVNELVVAG